MIITYILASLILAVSCFCIWAFRALKKTRSQLTKQENEFGEEVSKLSAEVASQKAQIDELLHSIEERDENIRTLEEALHEAQLIHETAAVQFKEALEAKESEIEQLQNDLMVVEQEPSTISDLDTYPFLRRLSEEEIPDFPDEYKKIQYLFSPAENAHFEISYADLHSDENKLSTLRMMLYERLQTDPEHPLLVCSCCHRPVLLSGNSGIKGEIIGFRHFDEGNIHTGEHAGENTIMPKQEDPVELETMATLFDEFAPSLNNYLRHSSFLLLPGTERDHAGDITFELDGQKVAVIFASAGHPLDFIVRRSKAAFESGFTPIWILSPSYLNTTVMSNRDISVFTQVYICTINDDVINMFSQTGEACLLAREYYKNEFTFIDLKTVISDSDSSIRALLDKPEWKDLDQPKQKRKRIVSNTTQTSHTTTLRPAKPRPTYTYEPQTKDDAKVERLEKAASVIDYWEGRRFKIKGDLYVEKIGESWGILNMSTLRYPVLPIYDDIKISDDKCEVLLIMKGKEPMIRKI